MSRGNRKLIDKKFIINVLLISGTVVAFLLFCGFVGVSRILNKEDYASGVLIDGVNISGMSYPEAEDAIADDLQQQLSAIHITLDYMGDTQALSAKDLGVSLNAENALDQAYQYNKSDADTIEQRFDKTVYLSHGVNFSSEKAIDQTKLRNTLEEYAARYYQSPVDAAASFDADTMTFSYTAEHSGLEIDVDQLFNDVLENLNQGISTAVEVADKVIPPNVTVGDLKQNTALISSSETTASYNENRNTNISLISTAVNGVEIKPGETFSINNFIGERTTEKGYKPASAISDGILADEVGGGICQLAGTLYNAALLADLEIVERVNHTWPSTYLPIGLDATLNWDNKDLKIKNTTDYSVFISAIFKDQKLTVTLYGQPLQDGMTIKVESNITKEIKPGATEIRYTNELPVGSTQTVRKARTGYMVEVYRIYFQDGVEVNRELISNDYYPALNKIVLKGSHNSQDK